VHLGTPCTGTAPAERRRARRALRGERDRKRRQRHPHARWGSARVSPTPASTSASIDNLDDHLRALLAAAPALLVHCARASETLRPSPPHTAAAQRTSGGRGGALLSAHGLRQKVLLVSTIQRNRGGRARRERARPARPQARARLDQPRGTYHKRDCQQRQAHERDRSRGHHGGEVIWFGDAPGGLREKPCGAD
jgi:hypothetical protein